MAAIHFDGPVVPWFQMLQKSGAVSSWNALAKAIESTYGPSVFECPSYALFKLLQENTVTDYYHTFTSLANRVEGLSSDALLDCFVSGLKKELQRDIIPWQPDSITKAFTLAKLYEDKYSFSEHKGKFRHSYTPDISTVLRKPVPLALPAPSSHYAKPPQLPAPSSQLPGSSTHPQAFTRMSYAELQDRRAKGLCYNCDEKFSPHHKCSNRRLLLLHWDEELDDNTDVTVETIQESTQSLQQDFQSLSLHAMDSSLISGTLRFTGYINGHAVQVLLDGG